VRAAPVGQLQPFAFCCTYCKAATELLGQLAGPWLNFRKKSAELPLRQPERALTSSETVLLPTADNMGTGVPPKVSV
jgi:hypothetical protein